MLLGKVVGSAVATAKIPELSGVTLLIVQVLDKNLKPVGNLQVAADATQAGVGDTVFMVRAREAALALEDSFVPVDLAAIGVVDHVTVDATLEEFVISNGISNFT